MPIDPSIIGGLKPFQVESPVNALAQMLQVQGAQQQNQLGQAKLDEHQRSTDRTNLLQSTLAGMKFDAPVDEQVGTLQRGGFLTEARSLAESSAKVSKDKRETEKFQLDAMGQRLALSAQILGSAKDQASYDAARQTAMQAGLDVTNMPPQFDAAFVQAKRTEGLTALQQLEQHWKAKGYDLDVSKATEDVRHNKTTEGLTAAGQAQTDARARETLNQGKTPAGYRSNGDGTLSFIPGGPADPAIERNKPLTETQGKATGFAARMQDANKIIAKFDKTVSPSAVAAVGGVAPSWLPGGGMVDAAVNSAIGMRAPEAQLYQQAQENWLTANLRLESGAVIGDKEKENEAKKWFPQAGDTDARRAQKAAARKVAENAMAVQAGSGAKQINKILGTADQPVGTVKVANAEDYAKVPSGSNYITPDGHTRRKP
jgi:hypothetical protein